ncbi:MAG: NADH-quinone oxidoreductase subunit J [Gammaproteobacteria bacterium]|jgi:NADH-quinone oxidoreductase subunit J|nr:NADH-quinone oxidoreductase subunit J [Gammaproteobacteria bacterium]
MMWINLYSLMFYVSGAITLLAAFMLITRHNAVHALLYLIVSSLSTAIIFYLLGAAFAAAMEVIVYAGAVMILFVFVVMMLNQGQRSAAHEAAWLPAKGWIMPGILTAILLILMVSSLVVEVVPMEVHEVTVKQVGTALFGPYMLVVELASFLLLSGLIGAFHIARKMPQTHNPEQSQ